MEQHNYDPLKILGVTGIFLFLLAAGFLHVFSEKQPAPVAVAPVADTAQAAIFPQDAKPDSIQALLSDRDSVSSLYTGMAMFYHAVQRIENDHTQLHIAYLGDSMIEGDLVTQSLRRYLQKRFGGIGLGFVPVTTPLPGFRSNVKQSFNDEWDVISFVTKSHAEGASPGISGYAYISAEGAEARYDAAPSFGPFHTAEILFGGKNTIALEIKTDTASQLLTLVPAAPVSSVVVRRDSAFSTFAMKVKSPEPGILYGVNFEYGPGIYVDNYAFRGNSGLPLGSVPPEILAGFNAKLQNKLLIIHYGLNVFTPGVEDYNWYEAAMVKVVRHLRESSPDISILMVSMPDRSTLINGEYHTPAGLPEFISLQQRVAARENIAFFNLYEAMGGANSMKKWVEGKPKLAGDDYTHPNGAGAARIASMIFDFILNGYDRYISKPDSVVSITTGQTAL